MLCVGVWRLHDEQYAALQCVAACCSVLGSMSPRFGIERMNDLAVCCSVLQCVAVCCSVLQCVAVCCSVLQCAAVCCSVFRKDNSIRNA